MEHEDALRKALNSLETVPPDEQQAFIYFERALKENPNDFNVLGHFGEFLCNSADGRVRNDERATLMLRQSIDKNPDGFPERYFYLGQCLAKNPQRSCEAEDSYTKGILKLKEELLDYQDGSSLRYAQEKIAMAYCAISELYLTDLCSHPQAEARIQKAYQDVKGYLLEVAMGMMVSPITLYIIGLTSYYLGIGDMSRAVDAAEKALALFRLGVDALENVFSSNYVPIPQWNSQLQFATALVRMQKTEWSQCVLDFLLEQDKRNVEVWLVLASHYFACNDRDNMKECLLMSKELLEEAARMSLYENDPDGQSYINRSTALLHRLQMDLDQIQQLNSVENAVET